MVEAENAFRIAEIPGRDPFEIVSAKEELPERGILVFAKVDKDHGGGRGNLWI